MLESRLVVVGCYLQALGGPGEEALLCQLPLLRVFCLQSCSERSSVCLHVSMALCLPHLLLSSLTVSAHLPIHSNMATRGQVYDAGVMMCHEYHVCMMTACSWSVTSIFGVVRGSGMRSPPYTAYMMQKHMLLLLVLFAIATRTMVAAGMESTNRKEEVTRQARLPA